MLIILLPIDTFEIIEGYTILYLTFISFRVRRVKQIQFDHINNSGCDVADRHSDNTNH